LQGEAYDDKRDVVCQAPPEAGRGRNWGARLRKPAYGMNDAPRRWFNRLDAVFQKLGLIPTRADRCCYAYYTPRKTAKGDSYRMPSMCKGKVNLDDLDPRILDLLLDPVTGSQAVQKDVTLILLLHVDDVLVFGLPADIDWFLKEIQQSFRIGTQSRNECVFTGQRMRWQGGVLCVDQHRAIEEMSEVQIDKKFRDQDLCPPALHTEYRRALGQLNWLQARTQFHACYKFSRAASAAAGPKISDVKCLNKVIRSIRAEPVTLMFWPLKGHLRLIGMPDAAFKNNEDKSSQRGSCIFLAEPRAEGMKNTRGSLIDYESKKIRHATLSTTVAELYSFMKCFGTCQFLRGLYMDMTGDQTMLFMRTDSNNLVTTARTTHLPEQEETIHMIQMLRQEAGSGAIDDLAHVPTLDCLSDSLTKSSVTPANLIKAVNTGILPNVDLYPLFRSTFQHKAYSVEAPSLQDFWEIEGDHLVRHHVNPRRRRYKPRDTPIDLSRVLPMRSSYMVFACGERQIVHDSWIGHGVFISKRMDRKDSVSLREGIIT